MPLGQILSSTELLQGVGPGEPVEATRLHQQIQQQIAALQCIRGRQSGLPDREMPQHQPPQIGQRGLCPELRVVVWRRDERVAERVRGGVGATPLLVSSGCALSLPSGGGLASSANNVRLERGDAGERGARQSTS